MTLVSVIIPVFNGAPFIERAVRSVLEQQVPVEVFVIDDGSTDGTQIIVERLAASHGVQWCQQQHGGPARARNRGLSQARGEYVALLDCDDVWLPGKLHAQLELMQTHQDVGVVHTDYEVIEPSGRVLERVRAGDSPEPLVQAFAGGHTALPSTLLVRRAIMDAVGLLDPELYGSEDSEWTIRLYETAGFECVDRVLVHKLHRGHGYRDMAFDEVVHRRKVLESRERFLTRLGQRPSMSEAQQAALRREWANYDLQRGAVALAEGRRTDARRWYGQAIARTPTRLRGYTRWLRTWLG